MTLLSRRNFLLTGAAIGGTALVAAVGGVGYLATVDAHGLDGRLDGERAMLNAFVVVEPSGQVTVNVPRTEMGQGIHTGLAMVVAEEMDLPFDDRIRVVFPTEALPAYANWTNVLGVRPEEAAGPVVWMGRRVFGQLGFIATGASGSTMGMWHPMRVAGASAREMLVAAAADAMQVPPGDLVTEGGFVVHPSSDRRLSYGELAAAAALLPPPDEPRLKPQAEWSVIGRAQHRLDLPDKVRGAPVFGMDVRLPGMLYASIRHAPVFGAEVDQITNEAQMRRADGVMDIAVINGRHVAVVASSWWQAETAARDLDIRWHTTPEDGIDSAALQDRLMAALDSETPHEVALTGDPAPALQAEDAIEATYHVPFVTHACMEPMNATVLIREDGSAEAWVPSQAPFGVRGGMRRAAGWAGIRLTDLTCNITMNGGAFGRRSDQDVTAEATFLASRHVGRPIQLIWPREEDIGRGLYRAHAASRLSAVLGEDGLPTAMHAITASQSVVDGIAGRNMPVNPGPDGDSLVAEGMEKPYYAIPNLRLLTQHVPSHLPVGFWRSNGYSFNTFFVESFIDECAHAAGTDPLAYRQALLQGSPRHRAVLDRAAELAGWGRPLGPGQGRGIAIEECYRSIVAQVAEVTVLFDGEIRVDRVSCAVDVGMVINPDTVAAQMEGGIIFGLSTALMSALTVRDGAVFENNFHDFPVMRIAQTPAIEVAIIDSDLPPGGAGEPGVVPIAAALGNAIFAATGQRMRKLPLARTETIGERRTRSILDNGSSEGT
jgi:isoquinoline 1-oxidoreductase subunit beta